MTANIETTQSGYNEGPSDAPIEEFLKLSAKYTGVRIIDMDTFAYGDRKRVFFQVMGTKKDIDGFVAAANLRNFVI